MHGIEAEVSKFAYAGRRHWREARIDVPRLIRLEAVERQLAALDENERDDPNGRLDAVEGAIETAIGRLPDPFGAAAREHFGFGGTGREPSDIESRRQRAANHFKGGRSERWYRLESQEFYGLKPEDYVIALVTAALCGADDPVAVVDVKKGGGRTGSPSEAVATVEGSRVVVGSVRWLRILALTGAAVLALVLLIDGAVTLFSSDPIRVAEAEVPPRGSIVDAQSGDVWPPGTVQATMPSASLEWGDIFRACNITSGECDDSGWVLNGESVPVREGDKIDFRVRLHQGYQLPISLLRLAAHSTTRGSGAKVRLIVEWPTGAESDLGGLSLEAREDSAMVRFEGGETHELEYVDGSTALYGPSEAEGRLARLPDGITEIVGIKLKDVGSPEGCWNCDFEYQRYVSFTLSVE